MKMKDKKRCEWLNKNPLMIKYHDEEWGKPLHDDRKLFEYMVLDAFQAGLNWEIIINKRKNFRKAFHNFDFKRVSNYTKKDFNRLVNDKGIIRNKLKIKSAIINAKRFLEVQKEFGSFDNYIWKFVNHVPIKNKFRKLSDLPSRTELSDRISNDLKRRGFKFVGSTICYAFMQAMGMVNDHVVSCFRHKEL